MASKYGLFTKDYRQSTNIEDKRDGRGEIRARMDTFGRGGGDNTNWNEFYQPNGRGATRTREKTSTPSAGSDPIPDDYSSDLAGMGTPQSGITSSGYHSKPGQARKVDAAEAVDTTYNRKR